MKKKILAAILALVLIGSSVLVFSSCQKKDSDSYSEMDWPDSELAAMIPEPKSNIGEVSYDTEDMLSVDIGQTEPDDYKAYLKECKSKGFTVDYTNMDDYYSAENKAGFSLTLDYDEDEKTMSISLYAPSKDEEEPKKDTKTKSKSSSKINSKKADDVSSDFKKTMDEYEEFMNDYVDFMKKYNKSDDITGMLTEYSEMMSKYSEFTDKIDDIDEDSLSTADAAYYAEVTARVTKKLAEIS